MNTRSPYCNDRCREIAGFVRQTRAGLELGWICEIDKQIALGQVLWHAIGGGRPLRLAISPARARETAMKRENYLCQVCGGTATTVDHIGSGCNRPINLRAVCAGCCTDRPFGDPVVLHRIDVIAMLEELSVRIASENPIRLCDDHQNWDWRAYLSTSQPLTGSV